MKVLGTRTDPEIGPLDLRSLTHELAQWQVVDGDLLLADGSWVLGFMCQPVAMDTLSTQERRELARRTQAWLAAVPEGEQVRMAYWVEPGAPQALRDHAARTAGLDGVLGQLREARLRTLRRAAASGQVLTQQLCVLVTYHPRRLRPPNRLALTTIGAGLSGILAFAVLGWVGAVATAATVASGLWFLLPRVPGKFAPVHRSHFDDDRRVRRGLRQVMHAHLRAMGLQPRDLLPDEYLEIPWRYLNPQKSAGGVLPPPLPGSPYELTTEEHRHHEWAAPPSMRELIAGDNLDRNLHFLRKDGRYVTAVTMEMLPIGTTVMGHLSRVLAIREPLWVIYDLAKPHSASLTSRLLARAAIAGNTAASAATEAATMGAAVTHESLRKILWEVFSGRTQVYSLGLGFVFARTSAEDLDRTALRLHQEASQARGMTLVSETHALSPQVRRLMPASGQLNRRMRMALSQNAAHLAPLAGPWPGSPRAEMVFHNRFGGLTALDIFDERVTAWSGIVSGATGKGKSMLVAQIILQALRNDMRVVMIDKGDNTPDPGSYLTLTRALGGAEIVFGAARSPSINPFDCTPEQLQYFLGHDVPSEVTEIAAKKLEFLIALVGRLVGGLTQIEQALAGDAILQTYRRPRFANPDEPTLLRHLVATLRTVGEVGGHAPTDEERQAMASVGLRLWQWIQQGQYAQLLDRPTNVDLDARVTYVDLGGVGEDSPLMPVIVLLLNDLIYRRAQRYGGRERLLVVADEVWAILKDPAAAGLVNDMYRRFRKFGASALGISQRLSDFSETEGAQAILGNASWWWLLPPADRDAVIRLAHLSDLETAQLDSLSSRGGEFSEALVLARFGDHTESGVIQVIPTGLEFWLAASGAAEKKLRHEYVDGCGGDVWRAVQELARDHPRGADLLFGGGEKR